MDDSRYAARLVVQYLNDNYLWVAGEQHTHINTHDWSHKHLITHHLVNVGAGTPRILTIPAKWKTQ